MPLPSVEAASREAAIAAAREKYGASVRIVGIRRVRTGGVMGFFTTERFVAEVEEIQTPAIPRRPASRAESAARIEAALRRSPVLPDPVDEVADLLSGTSAPSAGLYGRSALPREDRPAARPAARPAPTSRARATGPAGSGAPSAAPCPRPARDHDAPAPDARTGAEPDAPAQDAGEIPAPAAALPAPSPFTAALAQMVARDVDVRFAVDQAIATAFAPTPAAEPLPPAAEPVAALPLGEPAPRVAEPLPSVADPLVPAEPLPPVAAAPVAEPAPPVAEPPLSVADPLVPAEPVPAEPVPAEPVAAEPTPLIAEPAPADWPTAVLAVAADPVPVPAPAALDRPAPGAYPPAPPAPRRVRDTVTVTTRPASVPDWAEPDYTTGPVTSREEAIAEVLRAALARDTSDAALTDLLRGVLASSSTQEELRHASGACARQHGAEHAFAEAHTAEFPAWVDVDAESDEWEVVAEVLAPTASDPAPLPADATTVLPPLSLLPPPAPGTDLAVPPLLSRPAVPPTTRRPGALPGTSVARLAGPRPASGLATVTRLPVAQRAASWRAGSPVVVPSVREHPAGSGTVAPGPGPAEAEAEAEVIAQLRALGVPARLLGADFAADVARRGTYAALTRALAEGLPTPPTVPSGPGAVLVVVGPGVETLAAARSLAASLRLDGERLQWASRGDLAALAPRANRITGIEAALERKQDADASGPLTIVAVDAPLRAGGGAWLEQILAVFAPEAVWAVVEATRKPEDVGPWLDGLPRVDALMVQDTDLTTDPAAVLSRASAPVALLDGVRATAHRWASLLCERLETGAT